KLTTKIGDIFEGEFKNGKIDGDGIAHYSDGWKFKGSFKDGKRNGTAIEEDKDGNRFEGSYINDVRNGKFVEKDRNGNIKAKGEYVNGRRELDK
nr:phosphatidylinositol-4-phosphate 5-kinase [Bacteroidaceae bacterium]